MAYMIQMDPDQIRGEAGRLLKLKDEYDREFKEMSDIIHSTSEIWQGGAQQAYAAKFDEMRADFQRFSEMLDKFSKLIRSSADEIEEANRESASHVEQVQHAKG